MLSELMDALAFVKYDDFTLGTSAERKRVKREMKEEGLTEAEAVAKLKAIGQIRPDFGVTVPRLRKKRK